MLRSQLLLAGMLFALTVSLGAAASTELLVGLGLPALVCVLATLAYVAARVLELFLDPGKRHPSVGLTIALGGWQMAAVSAWLAPGDAILLETADWTAVALAYAMALFAAVASELGMRFAGSLIRPSIHQLLRADLAVAEWFARRRMDAERELLEQLARDAALDARLTHRLQQLRRRFERTFPSQ